MVCTALFSIKTEPFTSMSAKKFPTTIPSYVTASGRWHSTLCPAFLQFMSQGIFVDGLEEARPESVMNLHGGADYLFGQLFVFHWRYSGLLWTSVFHPVNPVHPV
jgi:hypothetical protein